jgi:uncharacterized protein YuzE
MQQVESKLIFDSKQGDLDMNKIQMQYFEKEDVLYLAISKEPEAASVEVSPNITAELNDKGQLIGIEIMKASTYIRDSILESVQAKVLHLTNTQWKNP